MSRAESKDEYCHDRVERTVITPGNVNYRAIHRACQITRRIKNRTHYLIRHAETLLGKKMGHRAIDKHLKSQEPDLYRKHPSGVAQRSTQVCGAEWSSFYEARKVFKHSPEKFKAAPKPPKYAKGAAATYLGRNSFCVSKGLLCFPKAMGLQPIPTAFCESQPYNANKHSVMIKEVRFVPLGNSYMVETVYDQSQLVTEGDFCPVMDRKRVLSIDIGLDNLAAMVTNQPGIRPVLINGKVIKSINALYNKQAATLRSNGKGGHLPAKARKRHGQIRDYLHKASRYVVSFCQKHNLGTLVIGKNEGWKQDINIGKRNNQNFVSIPHASFIAQIQYKAAQAGIRVIVREESYTSKASFLDFDPIPHYADDKVVPLFSGKRTRRGLYRSGSGSIIHADINGAANIMRKEFGDAVFDPLIDRGCVFQPVRVSLHATQHPKAYRTRRIATKDAQAA